MELSPMIQPTRPPGPPKSLIESRVFLGTLEHKSVYQEGVPDEEILALTREALKLDEFWQIDRVIPATDKAPNKIIAKWEGPKPVRQALPTGITSFIAIRIEKGVGQHPISCTGGETPAEQTRESEHQTP
jgi:hypothetical protein